MACRKLISTLILKMSNIPIIKNKNKDLAISVVLLMKTV